MQIPGGDAFHCWMLAMLLGSWQTRWQEQCPRVLAVLLRIT